MTSYFTSPETVKNFQLEQWIGLQLPGECVMYNNCGADNFTASWREQNETIPFTTTAQTPPSHVILFFYDCGWVGGLSDWLTYKRSLTKKVLKYFSCFFPPLLIYKRIYFFLSEWKKEEKRRVSELENGVCVPGIQTIWTPARRRSLIVIVGGFFQVLYSPSSKAWGWTYVKRLSEEVRDGVVASSSSSS